MPKTRKQDYYQLYKGESMLAFLIIGIIAWYFVKHEHQIEAVSEMSIEEAVNRLGEDNNEIE